MGEAHFTGSRHAGAAAQETGVGNRVMRRTKGPFFDQSRTGRQQSRDAVDLGGLQSLTETERREDPRESLGEHRLAGSGRSDHKYVVGAGSRNFEGTLGRGLPAHFTKIEVR